MAFNKHILVCNGEKCYNENSEAVYTRLMKGIIEKGINDKIQIIRSGCFGLCQKGPIIKVLPDNTVYYNVTEKDITDIINQHLLKNKPVERLIYKDDTLKKYVPTCKKELHHKQLRIVLRNCGLIDPEDIDDYIEREGYQALSKVIFDMKKEDVIDELKESGLRGRGGAGFPTWKKWLFSKKTESDVKYVVCNADEGDPGAYMDRSTLEGDPHSILEAMAICGYSIGAQQGYIYIRAEYPLAIKRLEIAIHQATEMGLLGKNILGSDFTFNIELRLGAGAFVCGEETALLASIEGDRGMPRPRPPFPSIKGLWGKPTVINNVETLANIAPIILWGGKWFSSIGTNTTKGTKVFALTGKVKNSGLIEVPMGTTLREVIFDIGGGIKGNKKFKAVQTGGPSGGVIPEKHLDTPIDYEHLQELGSIMGSGGMIVMDETDCMIDVSKFYLQFSVDESCGKCSPCRIGGKQMLGILEHISAGNGTEEDINRLKKIGYAMQKASLCGLGQTAPNPVLSTLKYFYNEYEEHINDKKCKAKKCTKLVTYTIDADKCIGCGLCAMRCPVNTISGEKQKPHFINQVNCIKCGECFNVCKFNAVIVS